MVSGKRTHATCVYPLYRRHYIQFSHDFVIRPAASATEPPTPSPEAAPDEGGEGRATAVTVVIVSAVTVMMCIGAIRIHRIFRDKGTRRGEDEAGDEEEGGCGQHSRQSSYARKASCVAPFPESAEGKAGEDRMEHTSNPLYAVSALRANGSGDLSVLVVEGSAIHSVSTKGASTLSDHTPDEAGGSSTRRGMSSASAGAGAGVRGSEAREGHNVARCERNESGSGPIAFLSRNGISRGRKQRVVPQLSIESVSSNDGDVWDKDTVENGTDVSLASTVAVTAPVPAPVPDPAPDPPDTAIANPPTRKTFPPLAASCKDAVVRDTKPAPLHIEDSEENHQAAGSAVRRHTIHGGASTPGVVAGRGSAARDQARSGASVLSAAEYAVRGAEALARDSFVPGVKEVVVLVAGLARIAAADHRGNAAEMEGRVAWCRSMVRTLERARDVLAKVKSGGDHSCARFLTSLAAHRHPHPLFAPLPFIAQVPSAFFSLHLSFNVACVWSRQFFGLRVQMKRKEPRWRKHSVSIISTTLAVFPVFCAVLVDSSRATRRSHVGMYDIHFSSQSPSTMIRH